MMEQKTDTKETWHREQLRLRGLLELRPLEKPVQHIIGMDIQLKNGTDVGVCTGVILTYPRMTLVDHITMPIIITEPYIPGFLAFREIDHYLNVYELLSNKHPDKCRDLIMTDGNGILHPVGFGLASHLGVLLNVPTIGCGKNLHQLSDLSVDKHSIRGKMDKDNLSEYPIVAHDGTQYGYAMRKKNKNPVYLSPGHLVSFDDVLNIGHATLLYREPEPVRIADRLSREFMRIADQLSREW